MTLKKRGPGRPCINEGEVMQTATLKISKADQELLASMGYNLGEAIREFCNLKRRTNLSSYSKKEEIDRKIKEEEEIQRASKAREQDLLNQKAICEENEEENARIKGDIETCKSVAVNRLWENGYLIFKHSPLLL